MGLNIEDQETCRIAREIANMTGESVTTAIAVAVRERLERIRRSPGGQREDLAERLLEIGRDCAARLKGPNRSIDHGDLLYDEHGMPK